MKLSVTGQPGLRTTRPKRSRAAEPWPGSRASQATAIREYACTESSDWLRSLSVAEERWRVEVTRRGLSPLSALLLEADGAWDDLDDWLDGEDIPDGFGYGLRAGRGRKQLHQKDPRTIGFTQLTTS